MCFSVQIDRDAQKLENKFKATLSIKYGEEFARLQAQLPKKYKEVGSDNRLFPNLFTLALAKEDQHNILRPMRYRLRPAGSKEEIPSKFNVYNARLDSLETRPTWKKLIGKNHCLLPFQSFYEWVPHQGKKALINFRPKERELMWAPGLYDTWKSPDLKETIHSFAIITTDPPKEIAEMGHDRCPIFLKEEVIEDWLNPSSLYFDEVLSLLNEKEDVTYQYQWAAK